MITTERLEHANVGHEQLTALDPTFNAPVKSWIASDKQVAHGFEAMKEDGEWLSPEQVVGSMMRLTKLYVAEGGVNGVEVDGRMMFAVGPTSLGNRAKGKNAPAEVVAARNYGSKMAQLLGIENALKSGQIGLVDADMAIKRLGMGGGGRGGDDPHAARSAIEKLSDDYHTMKWRSKKLPRKSSDSGVGELSSMGGMLGSVAMVSQLGNMEGKKGVVVKRVLYGTIITSLALSACSPVTEPVSSEKVPLVVETEEAPEPTADLPESATPVPDNISEIVANWNVVDNQELGRQSQDFANSQVAYYDVNDNLQFELGSEYGEMVGSVEVKIEESSFTLGRITSEGGVEHLAIKMDVGSGENDASWAILAGAKSANGEYLMLGMGDALPVFAIGVATGEVFFFNSETGKFHTLVNDDESVPGGGQGALFSMIEIVGNANLDSGRELMSESEIRWNFKRNEDGELGIYDLDNGEMLQRWDAKNNEWVEKVEIFGELPEDLAEGWSVSENGRALLDKDGELTHVFVGGGTDDDGEYLNPEWRLIPDYIKEIDSSVNTLVEIRKAPTVKTEDIPALMQVLMQRYEAGELGELPENAKYVKHNFGITLRNSLGEAAALQPQMGADQLYGLENRWYYTGAIFRDVSSGNWLVHRPQVQKDESVAGVMDIVSPWAANIDKQITEENGERRFEGVDRFYLIPADMDDEEGCKKILGGDADYCAKWMENREHVLELYHEWAETGMVPEEIASGEVALVMSGRLVSKPKGE